MKLVPITGQVLAWAIDEAGYTVSDIAEKLHLDESTIRDWVAEKRQPNTTQFRRLLDVLKRPSAVFFLPSAPGRALPPYFRRAAGPTPKTITPEERVRIRWGLQLQDVVESVLVDAGLPAVSLPTVGEGESPQAAAEKGRVLLGVRVEDQLRLKSANAGFKAWRNALEAAGILTFSMPLGEKGIRGFSSWDDHAPAVAVNTAYNFEARTYTLIHELGHLLARTGSSCWGFAGPGSVGRPGSEKWCDQFAADLLLPESAVRSFVSERTDAQFETTSGAGLLANHFRVSIRAAALRLIHLDYAPRALYRAVQAQFPTVDFKVKDPYPAGRTRAARRVSEIGRRGVTLLIHAAKTGRLASHDAAEVLRVHPAELGDLARRTLEPAG